MKTDKCFREERKTLGLEQEVQVKEIPPEDEPEIMEEREEELPPPETMEKEETSSQRPERKPEIVQERTPSFLLFFAVSFMLDVRPLTGQSIPEIGW